jgi:hypothetical protein
MLVSWLINPFHQDCDSQAGSGRAFIVHRDGASSHDLRKGQSTNKYQTERGIGLTYTPPGYIYGDVLE